MDNIKGKELVLADKTTSLFYRLVFNLFGLVAFFCGVSVLTENLFFWRVFGSVVGWKDIILSLILLNFGLVALYCSYFPSEGKITIGHDGIRKGGGKLHPWNEISYVYIGYQDDGPSFGAALAQAAIRRIAKLGGGKKPHRYLFVVNTQGQEVAVAQYDLNSYIYSDTEVRKAVDYWSGGKVGGKEELERQQGLDLLSLDYNLTLEEAEAMDRKIAARLRLFESLEGGPFLVMMGAFFLILFLDVLFFLSMPPVLTGQPLHWFLLFLGAPLAAASVARDLCLRPKVRRFRHDPKVADLSQREFDECLKRAGINMRNGYWTYFFWVVLVVWVLFVLYGIMLKTGLL